MSKILFSNILQHILSIKNDNFELKYILIDSLISLIDFITFLTFSLSLSLPTFLPNDR